MCGRFTLTAHDLASLAREWAAEVEEATTAGWRPRFNVAPGDRHPVLVARAVADALLGDGRAVRPGGGGRLAAEELMAGAGAGSYPGSGAGSGTTGERRLISALFGWRAPGKADERGALLVNARAETAARLPTFRDALRWRRAAVPADGFYEWEGPSSARRPTWFSEPSGRPMLFAALLGEAPAGGVGFVILTTAARAPVAALHDRMPLIVPPPLLDAWLEGSATASPAAGAPALPAPADGALVGRRVSSRVNAVENDDPTCLDAPPPPVQGSLF